MYQRHRAGGKRENIARSREVIIHICLPECSFYTHGVLSRQRPAAGAVSFIWFSYTRSYQSTYIVVAEVSIPIPSSDNTMCNDCLNGRYLNLSMYAINNQCESQTFYCILDACASIMTTFLLDVVAADQRGQSSQ